MADDGAKRPGYDARQETTSVLVERFERGKTFVSLGEYRAAYIEYRGVYNLVCAWMSRGAQERIRGLLDEVRARIKVYYGLLDRREVWARSALRDRVAVIEDLLLDIELELASNAKHLLLPGGVDEEELDLNRFLQESGA